MSEANYRERTLGAIKCYLVINKGKWFTAKEITEFLVGAKSLRLGTYGQTLSPVKVSRILKQHMFDDIEIQRLNNNQKIYRWNGGHRLGNDRTCG